MSKNHKHRGEKRFLAIFTFPICDKVHSSTYIADTNCAALQTIYQHQLLVLPMSMFPAIVFQHYTWKYLQACWYLLYTVLAFIMINAAR